MKITKAMKENLSKRIVIHNNLMDCGKRDCGFIGDCYDIIVNRPLSKNNGKSESGKADCFIAKIRNGKKIYIATECKSNEGNNFAVESVKDNYYIILVKNSVDLLTEKTDLESVIAFLLSNTLHYVKFSDFFATSFCSAHNGKYRILFKSAKYSAYLDRLPVYDNEIIIAE